MKYSIEYTGQFKKKLKLLSKRGFDLSQLEHVIGLLSENGSLGKEYKPHKLSGKYEGF